MKKIKILTPILSVSLISSGLIPLTSCRGGKTSTSINKIEVTTKPNQLSYKVGHKLNLEGMVVTATYSDGKTSVVTSECTTNPDVNTPLTLSHNKVIVTHTASGKTAEFDITVKDPAQITKVEVTTNPTKVSYAAGETLDLTGLVVTATYSDSTTENVTSECTTSPSTTTKLTKDTTEVTVTHTPTSKQCKFNIAVGDPKITSIAVTPPTKTDYKVGNQLELTGMIVEVILTDGTKSTLAASEYTTNPDTSTPLTLSHKKVTVTHIASGKTAEFNITVTSDFQTDTWTNVITYANQGLATLKQVYGVSTFIGLERKITINSKEHTVRVIGEEHDDLANGQGKATLTFELVTLLTDSAGNAITSKWDASNNYDYTNSVLRANLTGQGSGTKSFSSTAFDMLPSELQSSIKTVKKHVSTTSTYKLTEYSDKLFPLTYTEMAQSGNQYAKVEGSAYKYWINHNTDEDRIKKDTNGKASIYWLVSPDTKYSYHVWHVKDNGKVDDMEIGVSKPNGVSFGFCI